VVEFFKKHKKKISNWARILITVTGISIVATQIDIPETAASLRDANWLLIGIVLVFFQLGIVIRAFRWQVLLSGLGLQTNLLKLAGLYFAGAFFNTFLPTGFGGDVVRVLEVSKDVKPDEGIATVVLDRGSGLLMLFVMALVALPFEYQLFPLELVLIVIAVCLAGIIGWILVVHTDLALIVLNKNANPAVQKITPIFSAIRRIERTAVWKAIGFSVLFNILLILSYWGISEALSLGLPVTVFAVFTPLSAILLLLPSIQGWGVREPTNVLLLGAVGVAPEPAVAFSIGTYLLTFSNAVIGGIYYAIYTVVNLSDRTETSQPEVDERATEHT